MTGSIVAPTTGEGEGEGERPLSLMHDVPLPTPPKPSPFPLTALTRTEVEPVPQDVAGGPLDVQVALDDLGSVVEDWRRRIAALPAPGFLVTAADVQRVQEVGRLLAQVSGILSERA